MGNRKYEITFILPPALSEDDLNAAQTTIQNWITQPGGEVLKNNHWGRRRLAYPIQTYKEGYYILLEFQTQPNQIKELDRRLRLESSVLRFLIVRID